MGTLLALAGIVQHAFFTEKVYGIWAPVFRGDIFGPFVNKNHVAGWMLMALVGAAVLATAQELV